MAAAQRKTDTLRAAQPPPGLPSLQQQQQPQHHHPLSLPGPQSQLSSHPPSMGRPPLDRAHSFPTPPASASTVIGSMGGSDGFQWNQQGMSNGQGPSQISIDTTLSNSARSLPNTPATTPPGSSLQSMHPYPPATQAYDSSRQMYQPPAPPSSSYPPPNSAAPERPLYGQSYVKSEMGPPTNRAAGPNGEQADSKPTNGILHPGQAEAVAAAGGEDEADHEHDGEYTHDSGAYDTNRGPYNYSAPPVSALQNDHSHLSPELSGSPHQAGSGRATPRTAAAPQSYYAGQGGYNTPPRGGQTSSNLYSVMSNERGPTNGSAPSDVYASQGDMGSSMQNGYSAQPPALNGVPSMKRGRDDDDDRTDLKRRKAMLDGASSIPSPTFNQIAQPAGAPVPRRR